jgi:hypothetical protein
MFEKVTSTKFPFIQSDSISSNAWQSFFLSFFLILTSYYILIVDVEVYCCTWSHSMTHTPTTLGRAPLDEGSSQRRDLYLTKHNTHDRYPCHRRDSNPQFQQASGRRSTPNTNVYSLNSIHIHVRFEYPNNDNTAVETCSIMWIKYIPTINQNSVDGNTNISYY